MKAMTVLSPTGVPITVHDAIPHERQAFKVLRILEFDRFGAERNQLLAGD